ncbi:MAG: cellulase family glycosylhydrolase [Fibromonadaceae bacterium]|jgi:hypothetical protein|nr:cellulase family glycosylhydrolase [Fibromonadaceae bacterium]
MKILVFAFLLFATQALAGPVSHFGALKRCGNNICGEKTGTSIPIMVKGPSLYWSEGSGGPFYNSTTVDWFVDNMQIGVIRAAMAIRYFKESSEEINKAGTNYWGYYFKPDIQKGLMKAVVDAAIENDIYVIVDWHSHQAHNETQSAKDFFVWMANEYPGVPNLIWEVYNEPISASETQVTSHANTIVTALRAAGNNNLVLIGSPNYSKKPKEQAADWGSKDNNVAFTFHFYAASHGFPNGDNIGKSAQDARTAGNAVFGSEWGSVNYDGNGSSNAGATDPWTSWMDDNNISNCMWNASNLSEGSSFFPTNMGSSSLDASKLTGSGNYFKTYMTKKKWDSYIPSNHPRGKDVITSVDDGKDLVLNATTLGLTGTITEVSTPAFGTATITDAGKSITYRVSGAPKDKVKFIYKVEQGGITIQSKVVVTITNRGPILPDRDPIDVSRKAKTYLSMFNQLNASDPTGSTIELSAVSISPPSVGTVVVSGRWNDTITFTPAAALANAAFTEATLTYTVKNSKTPPQSSTQNVTLNIQNLAPTINVSATNSCCGNAPNTSPVTIGISQFNGRDRDEDDLSFVTVYLDPRYPGTLAKVSDKEYVYTPAADKTGTVVLLGIITDGTVNSNTGRANIKLTGNGSDIDVTAPTEIPGTPPSAIQQFSSTKSMGLVAMGSGKIELYLAQSGVAKLDVYSLSGKKLGSLLSGHQNAGPKQVSLGSLNLQKGVYILRLSQGSQVKTLRVVN